MISLSVRRTAGVALVGVGLTLAVALLYGSHGSLAVEEGFSGDDASVGSLRARYPMNDSAAQQAALDNEKMWDAQHQRFGSVREATNASRVRIVEPKDTLGYPLEAVYAVTDKELPPTTILMYEDDKFHITIDKHQSSRSASEFVASIADPILVDAGVVRRVSVDGVSGWANDPTDIPAEIGPDGLVVPGTGIHIPAGKVVWSVGNQVYGVLSYTLSADELLRVAGSMLVSE